MMTPVALPAPSSAERYRRLSADALRQRALDRLYERKDALQNLIAALERYQHSQRSAARIASTLACWRRSTRQIPFNREFDQPHQIVDI